MSPLAQMRSYRPPANSLPPAVAQWTAPGGPSLSVQCCYVTTDDTFKLTVWNSVSTLTHLSVQLKLMKPDGTVVTQQATINNLTFGRAPNVLTFGQTEGFVFAVCMAPAAVALNRGQVYVNLSIIRGSVTDQLQVEPLFADYLTSGMQPGYPNYRVMASTEGSGYVTSYQQAQVAGADIQLNSPFNVRWRVMGVTANLSAAAGGG